jgi:hypothetical protein
MRRKSGKETGRRTARPLLHLPEPDWPEADRAAFASAFDRPRDVFDAEGSGSLLKPRTKAALCFAYRRWLGWISADHPDLLEEASERRATSQTVKAFVVHLRQTCSPRTVASQVDKLYDALRYMYPARDWTWLKQLKTRLERATPKSGRRPILITSQRLVDASFARFDEVDLEFADLPPCATAKCRQALALRYRDALLVALTAFLPLRRTNLALLAIGTTIQRERDAWSISIPGELVKNGEPIDADLANWLGERVDRYVAVFRPLIHRSQSHQGFWASAKGCPATGDAVYNAFQTEVKASLALHLTLQDTRRIGATTWAVHDPVNAAGAKDLLGDRSDRVFAQHYNLANGVEASRRMAEIVRRQRS